MIFCPPRPTARQTDRQRGEGSSSSDWNCASERERERERERECRRHCRIRLLFGAKIPFPRVPASLLRFQPNMNEMHGKRRYSWIFFSTWLSKRKCSFFWLQEDNTAEISKTVDDLMLSIYQMDISRTTFLLKAYLRTRLGKVSICFFNDNVFKCCSRIGIRVQISMSRSSLCFGSSIQVWLWIKLVQMSTMSIFILNKNGQDLTCADFRTKSHSLLSVYFYVKI
jgi:hypothetical protein